MSYLTLDEVADRIFEWSKAFHPKKMRTISFVAAHMHEEVSEVFKAWRDDDLLPRLKDKDGLMKPEGIASELADVILTAGVMARLIEQEYGITINLEAAVAAKLEYQEARLLKRLAKKAKKGRHVR